MCSESNISVAWILFETIMSGRMRIRAGISYGEAYIDPDNSLFVGTPIIDAYRLEQSQQWSGAALTKNAEERIPVSARSGKFSDWWITPYPVPLKTGPKDMLAVKWTLGAHNPTWKQAWSDSQEEPSKLDWKEKRDICEKHINTKAFHDTTCSCCRKRRDKVL